MQRVLLWLLCYDWCPMSTLAVGASSRLILLSAAELFARQLLARVALRVAETLQRPPRRLDQPGSMTNPDRPQYGTYDTQI